LIENQKRLIENSQSGIVQSFANLNKDLQKSIMNMEGFKKISSDISQFQEKVDLQKKAFSENRLRHLLSSKRTNLYYDINVAGEKYNIDYDEKKRIKSGEFERLLKELLANNPENLTDIKEILKENISEKGKTRRDRIDVEKAFNALSDLLAKTKKEQIEKISVDTELYHPTIPPMIEYFDLKSLPKMNESIESNNIILYDLIKSNENLIKGTDKLKDVFEDINENIYKNKNPLSNIEDIKKNININPINPKPIEESNTEPNMSDNIAKDVSNLLINSLEMMADKTDKQTPTKQTPIINTIQNNFNNSNNITSNKSGSYTDLIVRYG